MNVKKYVGAAMGVMLASFRLAVAAPAGMPVEFSPAEKQAFQERRQKEDLARQAAAGMLLLVRDPVTQKDGSVVVMVESPPAGASCKVVLRKHNGGPEWERATTVPDCDFDTKR